MGNKTSKQQDVEKKAWATTTNSFAILDDLPKPVPIETVSLKKLPSRQDLRIDFENRSSEYTLHSFTNVQATKFDATRFYQANNGTKETSKIKSVLDASDEQLMDEILAEL